MKVWMAHVGAVAVVAVWGATFVSSKVLLGYGLTPADIF
ncbi:MAG TPA: EamA family transporter, partial [Prevotellaceae bacterium]|nr:EamA family transporter [Prevotellaceae bacterium]